MYPKGAKSIRRLSPKEFKAAFEAPYIARYGGGRIPATLLMFTMCPLEDFMIKGINPFAIRTVPKKSRSKVCRASARSTSIDGLADPG